MAGRTAFEVVGWINSVGPLVTVPDFRTESAAASRQGLSQGDEPQSRVNECVEPSASQGSDEKSAASL